MPSLVLTRSFYQRPVLQVARELLGMRLVRKLGDSRLGGMIIEAEAYDGEADLACHARSGRTHRNEVMYGPAGRAYVYFTYGMHWMLNCVTGVVGYPAAVLLRAIDPEEGLEQIAARRAGVLREHWTDGPAKLTQALAIDRRFNGIDLCDPAGELMIEQAVLIPDAFVRTSPRVGLGATPEPWLSLPWRFRVDLPAWRAHLNPNHDIKEA
jgi:DNA-3-methyladenine glycosylase